MPLEVTLQLPNGKTSSPSLRMPEGKGSELLKHCCHHQNPQPWWPCGWPRFLRKAISRTVYASFERVLCEAAAGQRDQSQLWILASQE